VSNATVNTLPVGLTKTKVAIYGAALGFGIESLVIALSTAPGRSLENLELMEEVDGVEVLGTMTIRHRRIRDWLFARQNELPNVRALKALARQDEMPNVHALKIATEVGTLIRLKGPLMVVPVGRKSKVEAGVALISHYNVAGVRAALQPSAVAPVTAAADSGDLSAVSLAHVVADDSSERVLPSLIGVDVMRAKPTELRDVLGALRAAGVDVIGIFGVA
jgi:hypothetical protein